MIKIPLTQGQFALVDNEDYAYLNQWKWYAHKKERTFYAKRTINKTKKTILMHQVILNTSPDKNIDHANGNGLDNQKINLRICTPQENSFNRRKRNNNLSGYKGVSWRKQDRKFCARIQIKGKEIFLGYFKDKKEAAIAYNQAAIRYHGEFAQLNSI